MIFVLIFTFVVAYIIQFYWNVRKYPKGPFPLPLIGNLYQLNFTTIHRDLEEIQKKYGDFFTLWFMNEPLTFLTTYDLIKEAKVTKGDIVTDRNSEFADDIFMLEDNCGVIFSSGPKWKEHRRVALQILRDFGVGRSLIEDNIHGQIEQFFEHIEAKKYTETPHDYRWEVQTMVSNVMSQVLFGVAYPHDKAQELNEYVMKLNDLFLEINNTVWTRIYKVAPFIKHLPVIGWKAHGSHAERYKFCLNFVKSRVDQSLVNYSVDDTPDCLAQAYLQLMQQNPHLTLNNCYNSCADFFLAGTETTVTTIRWAVLYIANYPELQKIREEIASVVGFERLPSVNDKVKMPYTVSAITEIQRHSNLFPLGFQHRARTEVTLNGHHFPKNAAFVPQYYSALTDERVFPQPDKFDPSRFLKEDGKTLNQDLMAKNIIFGLGNRVCVGQSLAKSEIFLFLTAFVQKFNFGPSTGKVDMTQTFGIAFQPRDNHLTLTPVEPEKYCI